MNDPGDRRCVATNNRGERCGKWAIRGATVCLAHGGAIGRVRAAAERRVQQQRATELARRTLPQEDLARYRDPFAALEFAVSYAYRLAERLAGMVEAIPDGELRYQGRLGEQLRGEVTACQRALSDLRQSATDVLRLNMDARRAGVRQQTADHIWEQLEAALQASGCDAAGRASAREAFRRNLRVLKDGADHG